MAATAVADLLEAFDQQMALVGTRLHRRRLRALRRLEPLAAAWQERLSGGREQLQLRYRPGSVLEAGCVLGDSCRLYANVSLGYGVRVGKRVIVHPGAVIGADGTYVKVKGQPVGIEVVVDDQTGELLGLDLLTSENSEEIREIIQVSKRDFRFYHPELGQVA